MHASFSDLEPESDYNIYSKQLASLGYGIPLWQPAPLSDYKRVKIADVGYLRTGQFYRLFNATLPREDPAQCRGVPENYQPLQLDEICSEHKQFRTPGILSSRDMCLEGVDFNLADDPAWLENGKAVHLVSSVGQGAILVTKDITVREDAIQLGFMENYMAENYQSWLEMANVTLGRGIKVEELVLVTGCDLTTQSTMAAFDTGGSEFAITFEAVLDLPSFSAWGRWHTTSSGAVFKNFGGHQRMPASSTSFSPNMIPGVFSPSMREPLPGPELDCDEFNQCVFLRGFRIRKRRSSVPCFVETSTAHLGRDNQDTHGNALCLDHIAPNKRDGDVVVESISDKQPFADPLESHFERIFENTNVQKALVHDDDISVPLNVDASHENGTLQTSSPTIAMVNNEVWRITSSSEPPRASNVNHLNTPGSQSSLVSHGIEPADWTIPPVPAGLQGVSAYLQRAQELKAKNPVISYWCIYFVAKKALSSTLQDENSRLFLNQIMEVLEGIKTDLGSNDAVLYDDASAKYIASFALRVFKKADSEDLKRKATRSTAKKFLASANFFELLNLFERPIEADVEEKIHYAKWKAADIAKAFRDGRKPTPGNFHAPSHLSSVDSVATPAASEMLDLPHETMSAWSPGASVALSLAPSPALQGLKSLESSPVAVHDILPGPISKLGKAPEEPEPYLRGPTPSPPPLDQPPSPSVTLFPHAVATNVSREDIEAPNNDADFEADERIMGGFTWNSSGEQQRVESEELENQEDDSSAAAIRPVSQQDSWTIGDIASIIPEDVQAFTIPVSGLGLGLQSEVLPPVAIVKRVRFSPSVVGGLSSTSSSVAASSPPPSPERYAPSLPTVPEAAYSSDSDREVSRAVKTHRLWQDPATIPLPESTVSESSVSDSDSDSEEGWRHGVPPVITKVPSPTPPSPSGPASTKNLSQASLQVTAASPQFYNVLPRFLAGLSPNPASPPSLHPTPRFFPHALALYPANDPPHSPSEGSASPDLDLTHVTQVQRHCKFAISALDYEDANTARDEIRAALAMLEEREQVA